MQKLQDSHEKEKNQVTSMKAILCQSILSATINASKNECPFSGKIHQVNSKQARLYFLSIATLTCVSGPCPSASRGRTQTASLCQQRGGQEPETDGGAGLETAGATGADHVSKGGGQGILGRKGKQEVM